MFLFSGRRRMRVITKAGTKITKATIEAAWRQRRSHERHIWRDTECSGLALFVSQRAMRWEYSYRPRGFDPYTGKRWPNRTVTIGNPSTHLPDDARSEANGIKGQLRSGRNSAAEKKAADEAERRKRRAILGRPVADCESSLARRHKLRGGSEILLRRYVTEEVARVRLVLAEMEIADLPAADLSEAHVRHLLTTARTFAPDLGLWRDSSTGCKIAGVFLQIRARLSPAVAVPKLPNLAHAF